MNVAGAAKRGITMPESGWKKALLLRAVMLILLRVLAAG